ncbi:MAG: hypothetical protein RIS45_1616, partial [Planctomycetota bacterium]
VLAALMSRAIASDLLKLGSRDRARDAAARAIELAERSGDRFQLIKLLGGLAEDLADDSQFDEAVGFFERAIELGTVPPPTIDEETVGDYRTDLIDILMRLGRPERALEIAEDNLAASVSSNQKGVNGVNDRVWSAYLLADAALATGRADYARSVLARHAEAAEELLALAPRNPFFGDTVASFLESYAIAEAGLGKPEDSRIHAERAASIRAWVGRPSWSRPFLRS